VLATVDWNIVGPSIASSAVAIAAVVFAYLSARRAATSNEAISRDERRHEIGQAWAKQGADAYADAQLLRSQLPPDCFLGLGVGSGLVDPGRFEQVYESYFPTSRDLRATAARAPSDEAATVIEEVHTRLWVLFSSNVNARNLAERRRASQHVVEFPEVLEALRRDSGAMLPGSWTDRDNQAFEEKLISLQEQAHEADTGSGYGAAGCLGESFTALLERFRKAVADAAAADGASAT
jgi:hypothetical protein